MSFVSRLLDRVLSYDGLLIGLAAANLGLSLYLMRLQHATFGQARIIEEPPIEIIEIEQETEELTR